MTPSSRRSFRGAGRKRGGTAIKHTCGHTQRHAIPGPAWKKLREVEHLKERECTACWSQKAAVEVEDLCAALGLPPLPPLTGTPRQLPWARSIRGKSLAKVRSEAIFLDHERSRKGLPPAADRFLALALPKLLKMTTARWWIDVKEDPDPLFLALDSGTLKQLDAIKEETAQAPELAPCPF